MKLTIKIGGYQFDGPYTSMKKLENKAGIYVVHTYINKKYYIIDIGESAMIRDRMKGHERMKCWLKYSGDGTIAIAVHYTTHWSQDGRSKLAKKLRNRFDPPCGKSKLDGKLDFLSS